MPQIKEAFLGSNVNTKSTLQYPFEFCSDVSFTGTIFSRNWHILFVLSLLISDLTFVFVLLSLLLYVQPDISKIIFSYHDWKQLFTQKCATNFQTYLENQLNNFSTWNNSMLMKYHTSDSNSKSTLLDEESNFTVVMPASISWIFKKFNTYHTLLQNSNRYKIRIHQF